MSILAPRSVGRVVLPTVLAVLALASSSHGADKWLEVTTPHFVVLSNAGKGTARDLGKQFEQMHHVVNLLLPWARRESGRPFVIFALRREKDLRALAPMYWEDGRDGVGGLYASGAGNDYVALDSHVRIADNISANPYFFAYWGYSSNVIEYSFPGRLPPWFQRGLSDVLANTIVRGKDVHLGRAIPHHMRRLNEVGQISAPDLFAATWDSKYLTDHNRRRTFDAYAWGTVHYLLFGDEGAHRPRIDSFIGMLLEGRPVPVAQKEVFPDVEAITEPVARYVSSRVLPYLTIKADLNLRDKDFPVREMTPAESLGHRGAFHVATNRPVEARARMEESRQADPEAAFASEVEGLLLDRDGPPQEALAAYQRAADRGSQNYWVYYRLSGLLRRRDPSKEVQVQMAESLRRAVELSPEHSRSLADLARVLSDLEPGEEAVAAGRKAVTLEPMKASYRLALTKAYWEAGKREEAQGEAEMALRIPADDRVRQDAQRWLDFMDKRRAAATGPPSTPTTQAPTRAVNIPEAEKACAGGVAPACGALAQAYLAGNGVEKQPERAVELLEKACQLEGMNSCAHLAHLRFEGREVSEDQEAAARLATKACDGGSAQGCGVLALVHLKLSTPEGLSRALELLQEACDGGEAQSCQLYAALAPPDQ